MRVSQASQCLCLDLPYAFAGDAELLSHFFQGICMSIGQAKSQAQNTSLARRQRVEQLLELLSKYLLIGDIARRQGLGVFDEMSQLALIVLSHRLLKR